MARGLFRKPSLKKRIAARTSPSRFIRHSLGCKAPRGWGWLTNPKKAAYNRVYNRTSIGCAVYALAFLVLILSAGLAFGRGGGGGHGHSSGGTVHVNGYTRKDGTYVNSYTRAAPGSGSSSSSYSSTGSSGSTGATGTEDGHSPKTYTWEDEKGFHASNDASKIPEHVLKPETPPREAKIEAPAPASEVRSEPRIAEAKSANAAAQAPPSKKAYSSTIKQQRSIKRASGVVRDKHGRIQRSAAAKRAFMKQTGYPNGRPGYIVDHIIPLKRGGPDTPSNMQWQTTEQAKAKDKWE